MFHSIKRLLHWAGGYRKRLYLGCLCSFFSVWCTAIPIVIAAWTLGLVIADFRGENALWNGTLYGFLYSGLLFPFFSDISFLTGKQNYKKALAMKLLPKND